MGIALIVMRVTGKAMPRPADFGKFSGLPAIGLVGVLLLITFVGALGEETGWRGYALPQLQRRFSPLASSFIIAVAWFLWHLPQFFVIATYRDSSPVQYAGMFIGLLCGAVVLTWLYNRSGGSILLVIVWHGLYNFASGTQAATGMPGRHRQHPGHGPGGNADRSRIEGPAAGPALSAGLRPEPCPALFAKAPAIKRRTSGFPGRSRLGNNWTRPVRRG